MEAVPRMPMIAFDLKNCSEIVEFTPALKQCIADVYHENPNAYSKECAEFDQLRLAAVRVSRDFMGCSTLKRYYAQLQFLRSRFPMSEEGALGIPFTWDDVYSGRAVSHLDIRFEQASVLYNIGALHSLLGAMDSRHNPEGMKVSCTHFQCAAWAFQHLRDCFEQNMSLDMAYDLLTFVVNLMLAQAQECILEKSMTDNRKSSITAKVAAQIIEYYKQASVYLEACNGASITGSKRYKEWKKRIELKMNYHQCIVYYYQGCQAEDQEKWGERVTFFQAAVDKLNEAIKLAKGEDTEINEALKFTMDVVGGKYNNAKKDNDFIYYDKVPPLDSLPEIKGAQLVKGIPFNYNDPEIAGPDIFKRLVPIEAHETSSLYSEEKAKLLRRICGLVEEKNEELQQFLSSLQLNPDKIDPVSEPLPQILLEKCAAVSVKPNAIKELTASMTSLSSVSIDVEGNISDIMELLDRAESIQKELGVKEHEKVLEERRKDCLKYKDGLAKASQSNMELHKAMSAHVDNLRLLNKPLDELQAALPSMDHNLSSEDEQVIEQMHRLMAKVDEMKNQRNMFEDQLRKQIQEDDITNVLVTWKVSNLDEFFEEQLKKHDKEVALIEQNISAQDNILRALTEANAKYAKIRKAMEESSQRRSAKIDALIQSYDVYEDLLAKCQKGVEFYNKLQRNVQTLSEQVQNLYKQLEEKQKMVAEHNKPKAGSACSPSQGAGGIENSISNSVSSIPGMPPLQGMDSTSADGTQRLTLKDYLPFMKPATFGKKSATGGDPSAGPPTAGIGSETMDPQAMMAIYGGMSGGISQVPQIPMHAGSLPNSHAASPVHIPKQPSSQPGSPSHLAENTPRSDSSSSSTSAAATSNGLTPGLPATMSYCVNGPGQVGLHPTGNLVATQPGLASQTSSASSVPASVPSSLPTTSIPVHSVSPEQILSPTSAPGAPSTRRPVPSGIGYGLPNMGTPPGGPSAAVCHGQPQLPPSQAAAYHPQLPVSYPASQTAVQYPAAAPQTSIITSAATQHGIVRGSTGDPSHAPGQPQLPGSAQQFAGQYTMQTSRAGQHVIGPQGYPQTQVSAARSDAFLRQYAQYSSQQYPMPSNSANTTGAGVSVNLPASIQSSQWSQASLVPGSGGQMYMGQSTQSVAGYSMSGPPVSTQHLGGHQVHSQGMSIPQPTQAVPAQQIQGQLNIRQPGQVSTGQPAQIAMGQPGQLSTVGPNQMSPGQQLAGQHAQQLPVQMSAGQNQLPAQQQGQLPMGQQGQLASGQGPLHTGQQGQLATGQGPLHTGQQGQLATGQGPLHTGQQGQLATGQGPLHTGQQGQLATGQGPLHTGQQGQLATGQGPLHTGQQGQLATGQGPLHTGQQGQLATGQGPLHTGQQGQPHTQQQVHLPIGQQGQGHMAIGQQGQCYMATSQQEQSQLPTGWPGQHSTGYSSYVGQPGQVSRAQQSQLTSGQSCQVITGHSNQLITGQSQVPVGQQSQAIQHMPRQLLPQQPGSGQSHWGQSAVSYTQSQSSNTYQQGTQPASCAFTGSTGVNRTTTPSQYQVSTTAGQITPVPSQYQYSRQSGTVTGEPISNVSTGTIANSVMEATSQQQACSGQSNMYTNTYPAQQAGPKASYGNQPGYTQQTGQYPAFQQCFVPPQQEQPQQQSQQQPQHQDPVMPNLPSPLQPTGMSLGAGTSQSAPLPVAQSVTQQQQHQYPDRASSLPPPDSGVTNARTAPQAKLGQVTSSSLDDLLSSSPERSRNGSPLRSKDVLTPKIITEQEIREQREEQIKNSLKQSIAHDPYTDQEVLNRFVSDVEKYEKFVESMTKETLSGPTPLDKEWKELSENQEKEAKKHSMAIARCYPLKNRFPDIMPYDSTRVILKGGKDDYINANHLGDLSPVCPKFIATQAPLPVTMVDFWQMVYEQGTEVIVALCQEHEAGKKNHVYWPVEKGQTITHGPFTLYLQSCKDKQGWVERIITLSHKETRHSRSVVHLQFLHWPSGGIPSGPAVLLQFVCEVHMFFIQQRNLVKPVIVHCSNGVDRTGAFCVVYAGVQEINQGHGLVNVTNMVKQLREKRKYMVGDKELLRFCHSAILYYAQDLLMKRGILTSSASFSGKKAHQRHPSEDFILGTNMNLNTIQSSVAKMKIHDQNSPATAANQNSVDQNVTGGDNATSGQEPKVDPDNQNKTGQVEEPGATRQEVEEDHQMASGISNQVKQTDGSSEAASSKDKEQALSNLPPSLAELQNPNTFSLEVTPPSKRKITKSSFLNPGAQLADKPDDRSDPLNSLDPFWTIKQDKA